MFWRIPAYSGAFRRGLLSAQRNAEKPDWQLGPRFDSRTRLAGRQAAGLVLTCIPAAAVAAGYRTANDGRASTAVETAVLRSFAGIARRCLRAA